MDVHGLRIIGETKDLIIENTNMEFDGYEPISIVVSSIASGLKTSTTAWGWGSSGVTPQTIISAGGEAFFYLNLPNLMLIDEIKLAYSLGGGSSLTFRFYDRAWDDPTGATPIHAVTVNSGTLTTLASAQVTTDRKHYWISAIAASGTGGSFHGGLITGRILRYQTYPPRT